MKIAFLSFYSGKVDRGVEVATGELARRLSDRHDVTVFQAGETTIKKVNTVRIVCERKWPQDTSNSLWRMFYLDYYSWKITLFTWKCFRYLFKEKYDLIIPVNGGWQVLICRLITWILGKKMLVQGNAGIGRDDFWQALLRPDHFVAISPQGYSWVKQKAPWLKTSFIPYGVNLDHILYPR